MTCNFTWMLMKDVPIWGKKILPIVSPYMVEAENFSDHHRTVWGSDRQWTDYRVWGSDLQWTDCRKPHGHFDSEPTQITLWGTDRLWTDYIRQQWTEWHSNKRMFFMMYRHVVEYWHRNNRRYNVRCWHTLDRLYKTAVDRVTQQQRDCFLWCTDT